MSNQKAPLFQLPKVLVLSLVLSFMNTANTYAAENKMNMDPKEMNGMRMKGKDGVMSKKEMKKMNVLMKDCMKIHNNKELCTPKKK